MFDGQLMFQYIPTLITSNQLWMSTPSVCKSKEYVLCARGRMGLEHNRFVDLVSGLRSRHQHVLRFDAQYVCMQDGLRQLSVVCISRTRFWGSRSSFVTWGLWLLNPICDTLTRKCMTHSVHSPVCTAALTRLSGSVHRIAMSPCVRACTRFLSCFSLDVAGHEQLREGSRAPAHPALKASWQQDHHLLHHQAHV